MKSILPVKCVIHYVLLLLALTNGFCAVLVCGSELELGEQPANCQPAPPSPPPPPQYGGCCDERTKLTGDWNGIRTCQAQQGITYDFDNTYYYYGVASGGLSREFEFGGRGDYVTNVDFGKLGLQEGLFLKLRAEHRYGEDINSNTGALIPSTIGTSLPFPDDDQIVLSNVLFTQFLSPNFGVFAGKLDTLDGDMNAFAHGRGKEQFSNLGFVANPIALRTVPYSTLGTGFVILQEQVPIFTFTALNATETIGSSGFSELFNEGIALAAELRLPTHFFEMPGHQVFAGSWNSRDFTTLGQDPRIILPDVPINQQSGSWSVYYNFDQYLSLYNNSPNLGWGVFGRAGIADEGTNPLSYFLSGGIGGNSPLCGREKDRYGIGWYYVGTSDEIGPLLTGLLGPISDGQAVELFYNYEVKPWFHLTPDLQVIDPARESVDTSLVLGVRGKIDF